MAGQPKEEPFDFGELAEDEEFISRIKNFESNLKDVTKVIDNIESNEEYNNLCDEDKVRFDLFLAFSINSLYWLYLRTQGLDPNQSELKTEINRVKEYMAKSRRLYERKNMPRLEKGVAKRFIRGGLWDSKQTKENNEEASSNSQNRKRKRSDSDGD